MEMFGQGEDVSTNVNGWDPCLATYSKSQAN